MAHRTGFYAPRLSLPSASVTSGASERGITVVGMPHTRQPAPASEPSVLQQRYDLRPRRRLSARARWGLIGAGLLAATLLVVWIVQGQSGAPTSKDVGFDLVSSAEVTADFEVTRDPDRAVRCGVEALNQDWAVVGYEEITLPAEPGSERTTAHRLAIRTTNPATTAQVASCWNLD